MTNGRSVPEDAPLPSPFPEGWYFIATRQEIEKAKLFHKGVDGRENHRLE